MAFSVTKPIDEMRKPSKSIIQIIRTVGDGYKVTGPFYWGVKKGVCEMTPFLKHGHAYNPAQLLGFWSELNSAEARIAELVIASQVRHGELGLVVAKRGANGSATYKLAK